MHQHTETVRACFNTWAREEPNFTASTIVPGTGGFQYLGSRGAQQVAASKADML